ncbi:hypothetical protein KR054_000609 [Drosophila jambulina]|nr:hypothetical protein KR054_000609 [Drosophila jambulina]
MKMVRPLRRKGIEEVYGSKMDAIHPVKSVVVTHGVGMTKTATMRAERAASGGGAAGGGGGAPSGGIMTNRQADQRPQRSFVTENDYYITTNLPMTASNLRNANATASQTMPGHIQQSPYNAMSARRNNLAVKNSARQPQMAKVPHFAMPENKVNNSVYTMTKPRESHRHGKCSTQRSNYALNDCGDFSDKELMGNHAQGNNNPRQHTHSHQMQLSQNMVLPHPPQHQLHQQQMSQNIHSKQQHQQQHQQYQQQQQQQHPLPHPHPHQKHSRGRGQPNPTSKAHVSIADDDDEKEDDPEEFFELIRQTVQKAVGVSWDLRHFLPINSNLLLLQNTISDALMKNFRDLGHKIDRFSGELKQTNEHLNRLQEQVTSSKSLITSPEHLNLLSYPPPEVIYYGEENSRHFRYLCMKSEYDKMFYQHQSMVASNPTPEMVNASKTNITAAASQANNLGCKPSAAQSLKHTGVKLSKNHSKMVTRRELNDMLKPQASYHKPKQQQKASAEPRKSSSDQSLILKSSEMGMRELLGQIQRFCNQVQMNDMAQGKNKSLHNLGDILVQKKHSNEGMCEQGGLITSRSMAGCQENKKDEDTELDTPMDSMDEYTGMDEFQFSSEVSSCSEDDNMCGSKYTAGDVTSRGGPTLAMRTAANKGAGDGQ